MGGIEIVGRVRQIGDALRQRQSGRCQERRGAGRRQESAPAEKLLLGRGEPLRDLPASAMDDAHASTLSAKFRRRAVHGYNITDNLRMREKPAGAGYDLANRPPAPWVGRGGKAAIFPDAAAWA